MRSEEEAKNLGENKLSVFSCPKYGFGGMDALDQEKHSVETEAFPRCLCRVIIVDCSDKIKNKNSIGLERDFNS